MIFWEFLRLLAQIDGSRMRAPETVTLGTLLLVLVSVRTLPPAQNGGNQSPQKPENREPSKPCQKGVVSFPWWGMLIVLVVLAYFL